MWYKQPIKDRLDLMKSYKKAYPEFSYKDMINHFNSFEKYPNGGKKDNYPEDLNYANVNNINVPGWQKKEQIRNTQDHQNNIINKSKQALEQRNKYPQPGTTETLGILDDPIFNIALMGTPSSIGRSIETINSIKPLEFIPKKLEELPKMDYKEYIPKSEHFIPSQLQKEIRKSAFDYVEKATSVENFKRAANIDSKHGTNFVKKLNDLKNFANEPENIWISEKDYLPLNIRTRVNPETGSAAVSKDSYEGSIKEFLKKTGQNSIKKNIRDTEIHINDDLPLDEVKDAVEHEIKHSYAHIDDMKKYGDELSNIVKPLTEINKTNPKIANNLIEDAFKNKPNYSHYEYYTEPHEVDAYINTNMRSDMVHKGILKTPYEQLTKEKLDLYEKLDPTKSKSKLLKIIDKDKLIDNFNKALYGITALSVYNKKN